jgi:hypothetical protein
MGVRHVQQGGVERTCLAQAKRGDELRLQRHSFVQPKWGDELQLQGHSRLAHGKVESRLFKSSTTLSAGEKASLRAGGGEAIFGSMGRHVELLIDIFFWILPEIKP